MANPRPDLQGWADKGSAPGWQERAIERVRARQSEQRARTGGRKNGLYLFFDDPYREFLDAAAAERGISLTGYLRRAGAAFIAHDLGLDLEEVARHAARPAPYGGSGGPGPRKKMSFDDGLGYGLWTISDLEE